MRHLSLLLLLSASVLGGCAADEATPIEATAQGAVSLPSSHLIAGVPWHQQVNANLCGAGALESVLDYWGIDVDQNAVADVARSSSDGTWQWDVVRTGQFSALSAAQGRYYPSAAPTAGFAGHPLGYGAFAYSSDTFWFGDLKALVARDIPVIVLVSFDPEGGGGHYRVVIGYDDSLGVVYLVDPWGRDQNHQTQWTGVVAWSYSDFRSSWSYFAQGSPHPYWAAIIAPWTVSLTTSGPATPGSTIGVTANVTYTCPAPVDCTQYPVSSATAQLQLPPGLTLASGASPVVSLGNLAAGATAKARWQVNVTQNVTGQSLSVTSSGAVTSSVPESDWVGQGVFYPPYSYTDQIGGSANLSF